MKVLHLVDVPWWSGLSSYAFDCLESHRLMGHDVLLACGRGTLCERKARELGVPTAPLGGREPRHAAGNFFEVGRCLRRLRPDFIVAHTGSTHWIAWAWGKRLGIPVIRTRAASQRVRRSSINRIIYRQARWVVAASRGLQTQCAEALSLKGNIRTIAPFARNPILASDAVEPEKPPHPRRVGILARLDPVKGHGDFLAAARRVQDAFPDAEFHIAGAEENISWGEVRQRAQGMGLTNVTYHGFLQPDRVWDMIAGCALGVIASIGSEAVSRALLEWMAQGRPVVATRVGGIPEILQDGDGGFLARPGDPQDLASKMIAVLSDAGLAERFARRNFQRARREFTQAQFKAEWHKVLYDHPAP